MKLYFSTILVFLSFNIFCQTTTEQKLIEYLGVQRYSDAQITNPGLISFLRVRLEHGFEIVDYNPEKADSYKELTSIDIVLKNQIVMESVEDFLVKYHAGTLNILMYKLPYDNSADVYYKLGNTGKAIKMYSLKYLQDYLD